MNKKNMSLIKFFFASDKNWFELVSIYMNVNAKLL